MGRLQHSSCSQKGSCVPRCGELQMLQSFNRAASGHPHLLLPLGQHFCSECPAHPELREEGTRFQMKPGLKAVNLPTPQPQGTGQSHLVQLSVVFSPSWSHQLCPITHSWWHRAARGTDHETK